jgi:hypothetical protein
MSQLFSKNFFQNTIESEFGKNCSIKGLTTLTPEMDCDRMAIGLPPIMFVVFLIAELFWENVDVSEECFRCLC